MAQAGFTPIQLYYSTTASAVPTAGNLASGELAINISDGKLYYKNASNVVTLLATAGSVSSQWVTSGSDIYYNTGNVGIGTTSPSSSLDVNGNVAITGTARRITGDFSNGTVANRVAFQSSTTNGSTGVVAMPNGTSNTAGFLALPYSAIVGNASSYGQFSCSLSEVKIDSGILPGGGSYLPMTFYTGGSERVRIDTAGNVGIGTTSPSGRLDVETASGVLYTNFTSTGGGSASVFSLIGAASTEQAICFNANALRFGTVTGKNAAGFTERARITSSGDLLVGTTTTNGKITSVTSGVGVAGYFSSSGSTNTLVVIDTGANGANIKLTGDGATTPSKTIRAQAGSLQVINNAYSAAILTLTDAGNLTAAGNVTAYSDERLKKDWSPIAGGFIDQLASVKSGTYTRTDSGERQVGVSAQDLQKMLTEAVSADNAGYLSVAYGNAALVACVELAKEVIALRAEIAALR